MFVTSNKTIKYKNSQILPPTMQETSVVTGSSLNSGYLVPYGSYRRNQRPEPAPNGDLESVTLKELEKLQQRTGPQQLYTTPSLREQAAYASLLKPTGGAPCVTPTAYLQLPGGQKAALKKIDLYFGPK